MGSAADEVKEMTILGRRVSWTEEGIKYEADEKHRAEVLKAHVKALTAEVEDVRTEGVWALSRSLLRCSVCSNSQVFTAGLSHDRALLRP